MEFIGRFISTFAYYLTLPLRWVAYFPTWFISTPAKLFGISLPARIGCLVWFLLVSCTVVAVVAIAWNEQTPSLWSYVFSLSFLLAIVLCFVIPFVVYYWLRLWLEGGVSRFPDIEDAWNQGLAALTASRLDMGSLPVYLIIGPGDERDVQALFDATFQDFPVKQIPGGRAALHWYANERAVYIVCTDCSCVSKVNRWGKEQPRGGAAAAPDIGSTLQPGAASARGTLVAGGAAPSEPAGGGVRATLPAPGGDQPAPSGAAARGTLVPGGATSTLTPGGGAPSGAPTTGGGLSRRQTAEQTERLQFVCQLLRRSRAPVCPMNGVLVTIPFSNLQHVLVAKDIPGAIKADLETIRTTTKLHAPVTALVTGMDEEPGFCELARRVGLQTAKATRFGKGYTVGVPPTSENLDAFTSHACGAFEDWVYNLFRERDGLHKPGNTHLYAMLCKIRGHVLDRMKHVLVHGFGYDPDDRRAAGTPVLFGGCYFAATGASNDRRAFVQNVFDKMLDLEEELEWTEEALVEDDRFQRLARTGMVLNGVLGLALAAAFVWYFVVRR